MPGKTFALPALLALSAISTVLPARDAQACACCGTYKVIHVDDEDMLNVRSGPGMGYQVRARLAPGDGCVVKTGKRHGNWVQIDAVGGRGHGWVKDRYLGIIR